MKLFKLELSAFGNKTGVMYPLFEDLDDRRAHYVQRRKEIGELITLLTMRAEAEAEYSEKLFRISDRN